MAWQIVCSTSINVAYWLPPGSGAALELGVGTGRIALPLSRWGVRVHGIELSPAMVAQMQTKPGADTIAVRIGDFATARVEGSFKLAYLVRNTITSTQLVTGPRSSSDTHQRLVHQIGAG